MRSHRHVFIAGAATLALVAGVALAQPERPGGGPGGGGPGGGQGGPEARRGGGPARGPGGGGGGPGPQARPQGGQPGGRPQDGRPQGRPEGGPRAAGEGRGPQGPQQRGPERQDAGRDNAQRQGAAQRPEREAPQRMAGPERNPGQGGRDGGRENGPDRRGRSQERPNGPETAREGRPDRGGPEGLAGAGRPVERSAERGPDNRGPGDRGPGDRGPGDRGPGDRSAGNGPGFDRGGPPLRSDLRDARYSGPGGRAFIVPTNDRVRVVTQRDNFDWGQIDRRATFNGCPPGLIQRYNGCNPPTLGRDPVRVWHQPNWYWSDYDSDSRYRYSDGYLLRLGAGTQVLSYIPLLGGALALGSVWPSNYDPVALPPYYASYYDLGPATGYRYYDDTIYRVDASSGAKITAIAALLTGNAITIGKPMPMGYEIYNVPYAYRDQYVDGTDAIYRYSDGHIYQLDPTTRLVRAAIELLS